MIRDISINEADVIWAAEEMINLYGDEALSKIGTWIAEYEENGLILLAKRCELIREVIKDHCTKPC